MRKVTRDELWRILRDVATQDTGKVIDQIVDPVAAIAFLDKTETITRMVDGYLVICVVNTPWYSSENIVHELLVVRVEEGGTLKSVAQFLRAVAQQHGATKIAVGTAFARSDRALTRMYQAEGFTPEAVTLTMEI